MPPIRQSGKVRAAADFLIGAVVIVAIYVMVAFACGALVWQLSGNDPWQGGIENVVHHFEMWKNWLWPDFLQGYLVAMK